MGVLLALEAGVKATGWAVFHGERLLETGKITCPKDQDALLPQRIKALVKALDGLTEAWCPQDLAYTRPFRNQWQAPALDELRDAISDWAQRHGVAVHMYDPRDVRAGVAGKANAPKEDLAFSVMRRWGLLGVAKSTAEWEAVATGDYHLHCRQAT